MFNRFAREITTLAGSKWAFSVAFLSVVVWAALGPHYGFSDTYQMVINTGTTIVTFLMVFLIQNSQNRDGLAIQAKLDELIRSSNARDNFIGIEALPEDEMATLRETAIGR